jgi:hypothetical protein
MHIALPSCLRGSVHENSSYCFDGKCGNLNKNGRVGVLRGTCTYTYERN